MPRRRKGPHLRLRKARRNRSGAITHHATWFIRDGSRDSFTGCPEQDIGTAEKKLAEYISAKYQQRRTVQDIEDILVSDVLAIYVKDKPDLFERSAYRMKRLSRIKRLGAFFRGKTLADVNGDLCREYQAQRQGAGGARRDLEDLRAAINHHAAEGYHRGVVRIVLPPKGLPRDRWLTRAEAARLLWACWTCREVQTHGSREILTDKRPLRHLARFILIGLYTGTRAGAIATASPIPAIGCSFVDLDRGIFYRLAAGRRQTNKRQPPAPLPPRLLAHMRRWHDRKIIAAHFVEWRGAGVSSVKTAFKTAVRIAALTGKVSPHTLRHTAATWLMQNGGDPWQSAGYLGMSVETLLRVYGHHHPDHLQDAVKKITAKPAAKGTQSWR
jgi:integrase